MLEGLPWDGEIRLVVLSFSLEMVKCGWTWFSFFSPWGWDGEICWTYRRISEMGVTLRWAMGFVTCNNRKCSRNTRVTREWKKNKRKRLFEESLKDIWWLFLFYFDWFVMWLECCSAAAVSLLSLLCLWTTLNALPSLTLLSQRCSVYITLFLSLSYSLYFYPPNTFYFTLLSLFFIDFYYSLFAYNPWLASCCGCLFLFFLIMFI